MGWSAFMCATSRSPPRAKVPPGLRNPPSAPTLTGKCGKVVDGLAYAVCTCSKPRADHPRDRLAPCAARRVLGPPHPGKDLGAPPC